MNMHETNAVADTVAANLEALREVYPELAGDWRGDIVGQIDLMPVYDLSYIAAVFGLATWQLMVPMYGLAFVVPVNQQSNNCVRERNPALHQLILNPDGYSFAEVKTDAVDGPFSVWPVHLYFPLDRAYEAKVMAYGTTALREKHKALYLKAMTVTVILPTPSEVTALASELDR